MILIRAGIIDELASKRLFKNENRRCISRSLSTARTGHLLCVVSVKRLQVVCYLSYVRNLQKNCALFVRFFFFGDDSTRELTRERDWFLFIFAFCVLIVHITN